mgnify:CR=1 FL=1
MRRATVKRCLQVIAVLSLLFAGWAQAGTVYVAPVIALSDPAPVIGLRYRMRIHTMEGTGLPWDGPKIVFLGSQFTGLDPAGLYVMGVNVFTYNMVQTDQSGCPDTGSSGFHAGGPTLWVNVPDYAMTRRIGLRPATDATRQMFPRRNGGIDSIPGLTSNWAIGQSPMLQQEVLVTLIRGESFTAPLDGWGGRFSPDPSSPGAYVCDPLLPAGLYRAWRLTLLAGTTPYAFEIAEPEAHADRLSPLAAMNIVTEFLDQPGLFILYLWDIALLQEGQDWTPVRKWLTNFRADPLPNIGWGLKLGTYLGQSVLEVSNDGTDTYAQVGDTVELDDSSVVSIPTVGRGGQAALIGGVLLILWTRLNGHRPT